ncbi:acyl-CoA-binding domain-containing protein 4 isoform X2 [Cucumis melo var. makuwa]|uniref:Acyl-CoA-binding domain-containing protein 4 isoform X2 n=2 Tax=Cucumis melo TaxID=3656 RepID=A0A5A7T1S9_CUCMM|nr:acyl-CoA-binding domain-containing protein 4 isoform X2 [Cucumis melo var. makuwa]
MQSTSIAQGRSISRFFQLSLRTNSYFRTLLTHPFCKWLEFWFFRVLDLRSWAWKKLEAMTQSPESPPEKLTPCAGHSLIPWENKLLSVVGHTKDSFDAIQGTNVVLLPYYSP